MKIEYLIDAGPMKKKILAEVKKQMKEVAAEALRKEIKEQTGKIMSNSKAKSIIKMILIIIGALVVIGAIAYIVYRFVICKKDEFDEELEALSEDEEEEEDFEAAADSDAEETEVETAEVSEEQTAAADAEEEENKTEYFSVQE